MDRYESGFNLLIWLSASSKLAEQSFNFRSSVRSLLLVFNFIHLIFALHFECFVLPSTAVIYPNTVSPGHAGIILHSDRFMFDFCMWRIMLAYIQDRKTTSRQRGVTFSSLWRLTLGWWVAGEWRERGGGVWFKKWRNAAVTLISCL